MRRFVPFLTLFLLICVLCGCEMAEDYIFLISEGTRENEVMQTTKDTDEAFEAETAPSEKDIPSSADETVPPSHTETTVITDTPPPRGTVAEQATDMASDTAVPPFEAEDIVLLSLTETVARGKTASVSVRGTPGATYRIEVYYTTTVSSAKGLEPKTAASNGTVTWSWKVGSRTKPGPHKIVICGENDDSLTLIFTTTE